MMWSDKNVKSHTHNAYITTGALLVRNDGGTYRVLLRTDKAPSPSPAAVVLVSCRRCFCFNNKARAVARKVKPATPGAMMRRTSSEESTVVSANLLTAMLRCTLVDEDDADDDDDDDGTTRRKL
jgi:hypothetical protein